ncbi:hypothetical protein JCM11491_001676 [Sporobolomyces phaffii]
MSSSSSTLLNSPRSAASSSSFAPSTAPSVSSNASGPTGDNLSPVVWKLALFTLLMIVGPIGTYFLSLKYYFHDPTPSAISAAFVANLVLVGFVVVAFLEDKSPDLPTRVSGGVGGGGALDEFTKEKIRAGKKE